MDMFDKTLNYEKTIKQLLKKINLDDWKLALNNEQFVSFLKSYTDKMVTTFTICYLKTI